MTDKRLLSYLERAEKLLEERAGITADIRDVVTEATSAGYDAKTFRKLLALRGMDADERSESEFLLDTYKCAIGMGDAPEPIGEGSRLARAAELFRQKKTVKQVAALMEIGNGTAGRLRKTAEALGLLKAHPIPSHPRGTATIHDLTTGEIPPPDRAATSSVPADGGSGGDSAAVVDPIPKPSAAAASVAEPLPGDSVEAIPPAALGTCHPDENWERQDSAGNYAVALEVLAERVRAAKAAIPLSPVQSGSVLQDAGPIPSFLDRRRA